jgi:hypothetical protein
VVVADDDVYGDYGAPHAFIYSVDSGADYVYAAGDGANSLLYDPVTAVISPIMPSQLTRQVLYARPDYVFVHDRVATLDPTTSKKLRWHFLAPPVVNGNAFVETVGASSLFGRIFPSVSAGTTQSTIDVATLLAAGGDTTSPLYRVDTQDAPAVAAVRYVTALEVAPASQTAMSATAAMQNLEGGMEGAQIGDRVALFAKSNAVVTGPISYTISGSSATHHLVDLPPVTTYQILVGGAAQGSATSSAQGVLRFQTTGGSSILIHP